MKLAKVRFEVKGADEFHAMASGLGWSEDDCAHFLEFGEYAELELTVTDRGTVIDGRIVPVDE